MIPRPSERRDLVTQRQTADLKKDADGNVGDDLHANLLQILRQLVSVPIWRLFLAVGDTDGEKGGEEEEVEEEEAAEAKEEKEAEEEKQAEAEEDEE